MIRTNVPAGGMPASETVRAYKRLAEVERTFRSLKTVDLHVRPIHHRTADRVRAHVFLCLLAYYVEWHMRQALKPLLFDDDDKAAAEALRASIVAPAQRSPRAKAKAATKRTEDGWPVHSFQTLLADLATLTQNQVRPLGADGVTLDVLTTPTPCSSAPSSCSAYPLACSQYGAARATALAAMAHTYVPSPRELRPRRSVAG